jgi:hypothetical protein
VGDAVVDNVAQRVVGGVFTLARVAASGGAGLLMSPTWTEGKKPYEDDVKVLTSLPLTPLTILGSVTDHGAEVSRASADLSRGGVGGAPPADRAAAGMVGLSFDVLDVFLLADAEALRGPPATLDLAKQIANIERVPMNVRRTITILETQEGPTLVAGGASDLSPAQVAFARDRGLTRV